MGLGISDNVLRRILDYNPAAHKRLLNNTNDWGKLELTAKALGKRGVDYDYALLDGRNEFGHGGDAGKLYNHSTFSNQSVFANTKHPGGLWSIDGGKDVYTPSQRQIKEPGYRDKLNEYLYYEKGKGIDKINWPTVRG